MREFHVRKTNFVEHQLVDTDFVGHGPQISDGEVLLEIDRFAITANNITYAVAGETLGYWQFFPPSGADSDGWGMMPVWGFADVVESRTASVPVGDRLFGFLPPSSHLRIAPVGVTDQRVIDGAAHRSKLPSPYNSYSRVNAEPGYDAAMDNERMLLWPLHITSFCIWDFLQDNSWFGARQIIILSASSKTSIGLAYALDADDDAPRTIALTSARNLDLVKHLKLYADSTTYDQLADIDETIPSVIVDMSGNKKVLGRLHKHLGSTMLRCIDVGLTHWDETDNGEGLIAERSHFFFAPTHIKRRMQEWGADGFAQRSSAFMTDTAARSRDWLKLTKIDGLQGLAAIHRDVCEGRIAANQGLIVELKNS